MQSLRLTSHEPEVFLKSLDQEAPESEDDKRVGLRDGKSMDVRLLHRVQPISDAIP